LNSFMPTELVFRDLGLPVYSVAQIRAAEERAFLVTVPGSLMQRAAFALGVGCADLLRESFGRVYGTSVLVVVGPGNNGGDALFAGALLARRGVSVRVYCVVPDVCHESGLSACVAAGGRVIHSFAGEFDLVLDGIAGLGSARPVDVALARFINMSPLVVAVDVPSGVDADNGDCDVDACIHADVTITFGALKPGLVLAPGAAFVGAIEVVNLDLEFDTRPVLQVLGDREVVELVPSLSFDSYKYSRGVVGIAAGSPSFPGAAVLSVLGAQHSGVGMVMLREGFTDRDLVLDSLPSVVSIDSDSPRITGWAVGPGFSGRDFEGAFLDSVLGGPLPLVLDAGALSGIADSADLRSAVSTRSGVTVITPHVGEFRRLFPSSIGFDLNSVRTAARELNVIVVAKGPRTLVVGPDGRAFVDIEASPVLGTAGSGDVLTGIIGGLLAGSDLDCVDVLAIVAAGVWIHSRAGRIAEAQLENPSAVDIGNMVGEVLRDV
jgi:hydroxyethylthiazole kinase-like uncharacterized protein yjeF